MTVPAQKKSGARWSVLRAEGKKVVLGGPQSEWTVFECESEERAAHIVRELQAWSKQAVDLEEFKKLCEAQ